MAGVRRALPFVTFIAFAALAAGCGAQRTPVPDASRPGPPFGFEPVTLGDSGVALGAPRGWRYREPGAPHLVNIFTGTAVLSVWRYPRSEPLPSTPDQLEAALENLLAAARARDPDLLVLDEGIVELDGQPAVALSVSTEIAGRRRTVQSVHAYAFGAEVVIDAYAGPREFFRVNQQTFLPVIASIELSEPESQT